MQSKSFRASVALVLVTLAGCATLYDTRISGPGSIDPGTGVVTIAVTKAGDKLGDVATMQRLIAVNVADANATFTIAWEFCGATQATCVYTGRLPAGTYYISHGYTSWSDGNFIHSRTWPVGVRFGAFKVESQRLTQLGTLVHIPDPYVANRYYFGWTELDEQALGRALGKHAAAFAGVKVNVREPLGWLADVAPRRALTEVAKQNPGLFEAPAFDARGRALAPARFGQILARDADGKWAVHSTGSRQGVASVTRVGADGVAALLEFGTLLTAPGLAGPWTPVALPAGVAEPRWVTGFADGRIALVAEGHTTLAGDASAKGTRKSGAAVHLRAADGSWSQVAFVPDGDEMPLYRIGERLVFAQSGKRLHVYDFAAKRFFEQPFPGASMTQLADQLLLATKPPFLCCDHDYFLSRDGGANWTTIARSTPPAEEVSRRAGGLLEVDGRFFVNGSRDETVQFAGGKAKTESKDGFFVTADLGATWQRTEPVKFPVCQSRVSWQHAGSEAWMACGEGRVWRRPAGGDWQLAWGWPVEPRAVMEGPAKQEPAPQQPAKQEPAKPAPAKQK